MSLAVEISVQDVEGLAVAARAGADRVELCEDLEAGGLTPSPELVRRSTERAAELVAAGDARPHFDVHVLVRAGGDSDFLDDPAQFTLDDTTTRDLAARAAEAVRAGAAGVVLGALTAEEPIRLDLPAMERIRDAALHAAAGSLRGLTLTAHRALDALPDAAAREQAMRDLVGLGFHRALSSGGAARAVDGLEDLARMVRAGDGLVEVCAGGGVRPAHLAELAAAGITGVHLSARRSGPDPSAQRRTPTDAAIATAAVDAAGAL